MELCGTWSNEQILPCKDFLNVFFTPSLPYVALKIFQEIRQMHRSFCRFAMADANNVKKVALGPLELVRNWEPKHVTPIGTITILCLEGFTLNQTVFSV